VTHSEPPKKERQTGSSKGLAPVYCERRKEPGSASENQTEEDAKNQHQAARGGEYKKWCEAYQMGRALKSTAGQSRRKRCRGGVFESRGNLLFATKRGEWPVYINVKRGQNQKYEQKRRRKKDLTSSCVGMNKISFGPKESNLLRDGCSNETQNKNSRTEFHPDRWGNRTKGKDCPVARNYRKRGRQPLYVRRKKDVPQGQLI